MTLRKGVVDDMQIIGRMVAIESSLALLWRFSEKDKASGARDLLREIIEDSIDSALEEDETGEVNELAAAFRKGARTALDRIFYFTK